MRHFLTFVVFASLPITALVQEGDLLSSEAASGGANTPKEDRNVALVMRFYEEVWHHDKFAVADEIFADDYVRHDASDPVQGPAEAVLQSERARKVKELNPDLRIEPQVVLADGDLVAVRWTSTANPAGFPAFMRRLVGKSGSSVATGVNVYRIQDGQVVELWNNRDDLTIRRDMGMFRWLVVGGVLAGVIITLLFSWGVRRWRKSRPGPHSAGAT